MIIGRVGLRFLPDKLYTVFYLIRFTRLKFIQHFFRPNQTIALFRHFIQPMFLGSQQTAKETIILFAHTAPPIISLATPTSSLSLISSFSAISFPCVVMRYSFFRPALSPKGAIQPFSCNEFNAPYKVPAPSVSRPFVLPSINCMTAYPCFGV